MSGKPYAYLTSIQGLRGVAVLLVVLLHIYSFELRFSPNAGLFGSWICFGNSGVDFFFLISGFVMVHTTSEKTKPLEFLYCLVISVIYLTAWKVTGAAPGASVSGLTILTAIFFVIAFGAFGLTVLERRCGRLIRRRKVANVYDASESGILVST